MKLIKVTDQDLLEVMKWFNSQSESNDWSGAIFKFPFTIESFKEDLQLDSLSSYCLVDSDFELVAFGQYYLRVGRCHLCRLVVNPSHRGKGIATKLMDKLIENGLKNLSVKETSLFVFQHNKSAIKAYEKFGFIKSNYPEKMPMENCDYMLKI
jgi:ribosomal protein S18 acetylase RimI-like enzyme